MSDIMIRGAFECLNPGISGDDENERRIIAGYASVPIIDSYKTIFTLEALEGALEEYLKNPVVRYQHETPIGKVLREYETKDGALVRTHIDENGLFIVVEIARGTQASNEVWALINQGVLNGFSIGGRVPDEDRDIEYKKIDGEEVGIIKRLELLEISVVDLPANREAHFQIIRSEDLEDLEDSERSEDVSRPFGPWSNFEECVSDMESEGYDEESARKICGALENRFKLEQHKENIDTQGGYKMETEERQEGEMTSPEESPSPEETPTTEGPTLEERISVLEERVASLEGALSEIRAMVEAGLAGDGETSTGESASAPVSESVERRKGAAIVAADVEVPDVRNLPRDELLRVLEKTRKRGGV